MNRCLPFMVVGANALTVLVGGLLLSQTMQQRGLNVSSEQRISGRDVARSVHIRGNPDALVTLEEFGDFECPSCKNLATFLEQVVKIIIRVCGSSIAISRWRCTRTPAMPQWLLKQRPCKAASGKCTTCYFGNRMFGAALPTRQCCLILTRKLFDLTCISLEMTSTATKCGSASSPTKRVPGRWGSKSLRRFLSINIKWERTRPTLRECEASSMRQ